MKKFVCAVLGSIALGCGGASDSNFQGSGGFLNNQGPVASSSSISGRVVDERGNPVAGVRLVTHDRTTDARGEGMSGNDGSFRLEVPAGVYDLGLDKEGDNSKATCFYGPIETSAASNPNYVLRDSGGRPIDQVFGKLWLRPGVPAANAPLILRPGQRSGSTTLTPLVPVNASTDGTGSFAVQTASDGELGLDLEVFQGGQLDEFIDVAKRNKPCYVEFATDQTPVVNKLRNNEGPASTLAAAASTAAFRPFTSIDNSTATISLTGGLLPVEDNVYRRLKDISPPFEFLPSKQDKLNFYWGWISVNRNHAWYWGKYAVELWIVQDTLWTFYDESGDLYNLTVLNPTGDDNDQFNPVGAVSNRVSYFSSRPNINQIDFFTLP